MKNVVRFRKLERLLDKRFQEWLDADPTIDEKNVEWYGDTETENSLQWKWKYRGKTYTEKATINSKTKDYEYP